MNTSLNNKLLLGTALVAMLLLFSESADAQFQFQFQMGGGNGNGNGMVFGGGLNGAATATKPEHLVDVMKLRIDEMRVDLELDEKQVNRLSLVANVVAKKAFEERNNPLLAPMRATRERVDADDDSFSDEDDDSRENQDSMEQELTRLETPVLVETALKHKTWLKAIDSVLTDDQKAKHEKVKADRKKEIRDTVISYRVLQLRDQLSLRSDQLEDVAVVVDEIEGDALVQKFRSSGDLLGMIGGNMDSRTVTSEDLKDILSESQMLVAERQESVDPMGGMGNILGAAMGVPQQNSKRKLGVKLDSGGLLTVVEVTPGSVADNIGVRTGDIIDSVNGNPIDNRYQLRKALGKGRSKISLTVIRDGNTVELSE